MIKIDKPSNSVMLCVFIPHSDLYGVASHDRWPLLSKPRHIHSIQALSMTEVILMMDWADLSGTEIVRGHVGFHLDLLCEEEIVMKGYKLCRIIME